MLKIGVTGNIGAGKSQVCLIFSMLGIPVYSADTRARQLMVESPQLIKEIRTLLGDEAYFEDQSLNRKYIAQIVFSDQSVLEQLNALVHPAVAIDFAQWTDRQKDVPYVIKEAALLFEAGSYRMLDKTILVTAEQALRLKRVMKRDGVTEQDVLNRMDKQMAQDDKIRLADYIIDNNGHSFLVRQVLDLHRLFISQK